MKKLLLTLALVLGFMTVAQAEDVKMPADDKTWGSYTWTKSGNDLHATIDDYTFDYMKGSGTTAPRNPSTNSDGEVRVYAKNEFKVTAPEGKKFKKITFHPASSNKTTSKVTAAGWTYSSTGTNTSTYEVTFTATTGQSSITVINGNTSQWNFASVTITLSDSGEEETVVATPTFNPAASAVDAGTSVSIACSTEGATIHYTTDDSDVSATSPVYSAPIVVNEAMTIKAIAVKDGMTDSPVAIAEYTIKQDVSVDGQATYNFADPSSLTPSYTNISGNEVSVANVDFTANGCSFKANDRGTVKARLYKSSDKWTYRIYNGAVLTIKAPNGCKFTSIDFGVSFGATFSDGKYNNNILSFESEPEDISEVICTVKKNTNFSTVVINFAPIVPDAPEVVLPSDFTGTKDQIDLDNYKPANPEDPAHLWFNVDVTWKEGLKLHYRTTSWGAKLNGEPLKASTTPATAAYAAGTTDKQSVEYTGTIESGSSATFSFGSQGVFECYTENEYGHQSDPETVSFIGEATGVEDIVAGKADGEAVYYNMQGVRVANPAAGNLYIKVQGDKATKVLVK